MLLAPKPLLLSPHPAAISNSGTAAAAVLRLIFVCPHPHPCAAVLTVFAAVFAEAHFRLRVSSPPAPTPQPPRAVLSVDGVPSEERNDDGSDGEDESADGASGGRSLLPAAAPPPFAALPAHVLAASLPPQMVETFQMIFGACAFGSVVEVRRWHTRCKAPEGRALAVRYILLGLTAFACWLTDNAFCDELQALPVYPHLHSWCVCWLQRSQA